MADYRSMGFNSDYMYIHLDVILRVFYVIDVDLELELPEIDLEVEVPEIELNIRD